VTRLWAGMSGHLYQTTQLSAFDAQTSSCWILFYFVCVSFLLFSCSSGLIFKSNDVYDILALVTFIHT